jgi:hypothetical protein
MPSALWWKTFYAQERAGLDLDAILDAAPELPFPERGAFVFPHTRLGISGRLTASVARAAARLDRHVLAIGVLHGARERDAEDVARARAGDPRAREQFRGIHDETGLAAEEFSLDGFRALYERACLREGRTPRLTARYPFLTGERPEDLPGLESLATLVRESLVVATADPVHHGAGYGTAETLDESLVETRAVARRRIEDQLGALGRADFSDFARLCARDLSDFRDAGPLVALLRPRCAWTLEELALVDYSDVLGARRPTWVAAGRIRVAPLPPRA